MTPALAAAGLPAILSSAAFGQAATSPPSFEVASVKLNKSGDRRSGVRAYPERLTGTNKTQVAIKPSLMISVGSAIRTRIQRSKRGRERAKLFSARSLADIHIRIFKDAATSFNKLRFTWDKLFYAPLQSWWVWRKYRRALNKDSP